MLNHYEGWSESDLLILRRSLQGQTVTGQVLSSSIAGVSVTKAATQGGQSRIVTLKRVQYSLWVIGNARFVADATVANPYQNPYTSTVKRTRASYL